MVSILRKKISAEVIPGLVFISNMQIFYGRSQAHKPLHSAHCTFYLARTTRRAHFCPTRVPVAIWVDAEAFGAAARTWVAAGSTASSLDSAPDTARVAGELRVAGLTGRPE